MASPPRVLHDADNVQVQAALHSSSEGGGVIRGRPRDSYEHALDDGSTPPEENGEGANAFIVTQLHTISAGVQAGDTRREKMEARMSSIEELLRSRPANQECRQSATKAIEESYSSDEESS
ncbi:hypothetical protein PF005_g15265 [Phytophthora fragariae]|uniref:Uncharacterized protein n=1 Tax=Phytophthora fragariae TaxID=53985 RepID=A0A6A3XDD8_9STRA|nr:hypothetical protein PF010_g15809 [Phytophthora fragariae]KAE9200656.1 hypothetical protein PF005_g15265 [Phytophthora fragariae]